MSAPNTDTAAKLISLDHTLAQYGPDAQWVRADMHLRVAAAVKRDWPEEDIPETVEAAPQHSNTMEGLQDEIIKLVPVDDNEDF